MFLPGLIAIAGVGATGNLKKAPISSASGKVPVRSAVRDRL